jgi:ring-1,2-phenylacetyl-CoA epoxidase subunit PaaC
MDRGSAPAAAPDRTVAPQTGAAFRAWVLRTADDELIIGHRHSEWTGFAPDIESDVALSSIAQEEIGHARAFYSALASGDGREADRLAFGRVAGAYRHAVLVERENGGWEWSLVRLALYERYDQERLRLLAASGQEPVAGLARTLLREERYHSLFAETWLTRLAAGSGEGRRRVQAALDDAWPDVLGLFEWTEEDAELLRAGLLQMDGAAQRAAWEHSVAPLLASCGLVRPESAPREGGRRGRHTETFDRLLAEMTEVWRSDPEARW